MLLVYISGPYTGDIVADRKQAATLGSYLMQEGFAIFIPHEQPNKLTILERCDCLIRFKEESEECDEEVAYANSANINVFTNYKELLTFFREGLND